MPAIGLYDDECGPSSIVTLGVEVCSTEAIPGAPVEKLPLGHAACPLRYLSLLTIA